MNQQRLSRLVVERLEREASRDRQSRVLVGGSLSTNDEPGGLAADLFGAAPTDSQLRVLESVLFRLSEEGRVEVAAFAGGAAAANGPTQPLRPSDQTRFELIGPGSNVLRNGRYGVRLAHTA